MPQTLAIAPQLLAQLQIAIPSPWASGDRPLGSVPRTWPPSIPLYRAKDSQRILYISPVALQLAKPLSQPPLEIAQAIAQGFRDSRPPDLDWPLETHHWRLSVLPPGKLYLELTDPGIAIWLQQALEGDLQSHPPLGPGPLTPGESLNVFPIQYAHARCCALLRLAHREGWNTSPSLVPGDTPLPFPPPLDAPPTPGPIPWLDSQSQLKPQHPAERALISQAIATLDALSAPESISQKTSRFVLATNLSQDFLTFYAQCQIWGWVASKNPDLARARLGLVFLTQKILKRLLEKDFGRFAPLEL